MRIRVALAVLLLLLFSPSGNAAKRKKPLVIELSSRSGALPLVTLKASDVPLGEVAERLAKKLGTRIDLSAAARNLRVTTRLDRQPLDLALRELAPQAYVDGVLTGGTGHTVILAIHLHGAGETAPPLTELEKRHSEALIVIGNTEDPAVNPLEGRLDVTYRNGRLRVLAKSQPLSVVASQIAEALGIPFEMNGDSREVIDVTVDDATLEQVMRALTPSVRLYHRKDLATFEVTPVRLVLHPSPAATDARP